MLEDNGWGHGSQPRLGKMPLLYRHFAASANKCEWQHGRPHWCKVDSDPSVAESHGALPMSYNAHRFAHREHLGLTPGEFAVLERLSTPQTMHAFLNAICTHQKHAGKTTLHAPEQPTQHNH